jgi:hypothetical protein
MSETRKQLSVENSYDEEKVEERVHADLANNVQAR